MKTLAISKMGLNTAGFYAYLLNNIVKMEEKFSVEVVEFNKYYDFILFDGGSDITPSFYNEEANIKTMNNPIRDKYETEIYLHYLPFKTKFLGICRGSQFLNVMCGGTLYQDLYEVNLGHPYYHDIDIVYPVADFIPNNIVVNSTHHQAVKTLGKNLEVVAIDTFTRVVEAYKSKDDKIRAVQFHPEFADAFRYANNFISWLFRTL